MEILIATTNPGKVREYRTLLANAPVTLLSLEDIGLGKLDVEETGRTFQENAELKASTYAKASGKWALSDDSGLCVNALDGAPGLHSARYAGKGASDKDRRLKLLGELENIEDRSAYFTCVIALANPETLACITVEGRCNGQIALQDGEGELGFGYDAIFIPDGDDKTFADIPKEEKNKISHRGVAAAKLAEQLRALAADAD